MESEVKKRIFAALEELEVDDEGCVLTFQTVPDFSVRAFSDEETAREVVEAVEPAEEIVPEVDVAAAEAESVEAPVEATVAAIDAIGEVPAPKYVNKNFAQKMMLADEVIQDRYDEVKNYALRFKKLKARISKKFESINQGRLQFVKLSVAGKTLKLYLNMDISEVDPKFRCKDMRDKVTYETVPTMLRIKSGRAVRYAKILIDQCAAKYGLVENKKFVEVDAMKVIEDFLLEREAKRRAKLGDAYDEETENEDFLEEIASAFESALEGAEEIPSEAAEITEENSEEATEETAEEVAEEITAVVADEYKAESEKKFCPNPAQKDEAWTEVSLEERNQEPEEITQSFEEDTNQEETMEKAPENAALKSAAAGAKLDADSQIVTAETVKNQLKDYENLYPRLSDYYGNIEELKVSSLQEVACQRDWTYLRKVSTILHIIASIIAHPHINNKREEIVTRIEQAKQLSNEDFTRVLQDGSLWKRYDMRMVPEEVYYYQNVDELCIYENQFICLVVDLLEGELNEYSNFYVKMLPSMKNGLLKRLDGRKPQRILRYADLLKRRITYVKNTRFYKEVSAAKPISRNIERTNILLKDNLYSRVYRFYREYLGTEERFITYDLLKDYLSALVMKELSARGFKIKDCAEAKSFENEDFLLSYNYSEEFGGFVFDILEKLSGISAKHLLILSLSAWFSDVEKAPSKFDTVEAVSEWARVNVGKTAEDYEEIFTEKKIVSDYLSDKLCKTDVLSDVYDRYCPVCREKNPLENDSVYHCPHCSSRYIFTKNQKGENALWFLRLRRHR